jgi:hypothetical protein
VKDREETTMESNWLNETLSRKADIEYTLDDALRDGAVVPVGLGTCYTTPKLFARLAERIGSERGAIAILDALRALYDRGVYAFELESVGLSNEAHAEANEALAYYRACDIDVWMSANGVSDSPTAHLPEER